MLKIVKVKRPVTSAVEFVEGSPSRDPATAKAGPRGETAAAPVGRALPGIRRHPLPAGAGLRRRPRPARPAAPPARPARRARRHPRRAELVLSGAHRETEVTGTLAQLDELGLIEDAAADGEWLSPAERVALRPSAGVLRRAGGRAATPGPACQARLRAGACGRDRARRPGRLGPLGARRGGGGRPRGGRRGRRGAEQPQPTDALSRAGRRPAQGAGRGPHAGGLQLDDLVRGDDRATPGPRRGRRCRGRGRTS